MQRPRRQRLRSKLRPPTTDHRRTIPNAPLHIDAGSMDENEVDEQSTLPTDPLHIDEGSMDENEVDEQNTASPTHFLPSATSSQVLIGLFDNVGFRRYCERWVHKRLARHCPVMPWCDQTPSAYPFGTMSVPIKHAAVGDTCFLSPHQTHPALEADRGVHRIAGSPRYPIKGIRQLNMGKWVLLGCRMLTRN